MLCLIKSMQHPSKLSHPSLSLHPLNQISVVTQYVKIVKEAKTVFGNTIQSNTVLTKRAEGFSVTNRSAKAASHLCLQKITSPSTSSQLIISNWLSHCTLKSGFPLTLMTLACLTGFSHSFQHLLCCGTLLFSPEIHLPCHTGL